MKTRKDMREHANRLVHYAKQAPSESVRGAFLGEATRLATVYGFVLVDGRYVSAEGPLAIDYPWGDY